MSKHVIPGLLTEDDFRQFTMDHYGALSAVLNDVLAQILKTYTQEPDSAQDVVARIRQFLGPKIDSYTFHIELEKRGILDMLRSLDVDGILNTPISYQEDVVLKIKYILDNEKNIRATLPCRTREAWNTFQSMMKVNIIHEIPDFSVVLEANKSLFYNPREKDISLSSNYVIRRKNEWIRAYNAIRYDTYCKRNGVPDSQRSNFYDFGWAV